MKKKKLPCSIVSCVKDIVKWEIQKTSRNIPWYRNITPWLCIYGQLQGGPKEWTNFWLTFGKIKWQPNFELRLVILCPCEQQKWLKWSLKKLTPKKLPGNGVSYGLLNASHNFFWVNFFQKVISTISMAGMGIKPCVNWKRIKWNFVIWVFFTLLVPTIKEEYPFQKWFTFLGHPAHLWNQTNMYIETVYTYRNK